MKYKVFDVVELKSGENATILNINKDLYKVQVTDKNGVQKESKEVQMSDISNLIYTRRG